MTATKMVFQRLEKKYIITQEQMELLLEKANDKLTNDIFGASTICNIYFDTDQYHLINTSVQKPPYKEKLRMRSYGVANEESCIYLEIKKKYKGIVNKRRISLSLSMAQALLNEGKLPLHDTQIQTEIAYFINYYKPKPKVFIAYERTALIGSEDKELRITFDSQIRRRYEQLDLSRDAYGKQLLAPKQILMEIKVPHTYPLWLTHILSELKFYPTSFSKYGNIFLEDIIKGKQLPLAAQATYQNKKSGILEPQKEESYSCLQAY